MVTDDDRREAARKLRGLCDYETAETIVRTCLGFERGELMDKVTRRRMSDRVADLIDPVESGQDQDENGTCRDESGRCPKTCPEMSGIDPDTRNCSEPTRKCDRDALIKLAVELDQKALELLKTNDLDSNRKRRGMRSAHASDLMAASSRIRDALGVENG